MRRIGYIFFSQRRLVFKTFCKMSSMINIIPYDLNLIQTNKLESLYKDELTIPSLLKKIESSSYFLINPTIINVSKFNFLLSNEAFSSLSTSDLTNYFSFFALYPQYNDQSQILENLLIQNLNSIDFNDTLKIALSICSQFKSNEKPNNQLWDLLISKIKNFVAQKNLYKSLDMYTKCFVTMIFHFANELEFLLKKDYEIIYMQEYEFRFLEKVISELSKKMKMNKEEFCLNNKVGVLDFGIKLKNSNTYLELYKLNDPVENDGQVNWLRKLKTNYVENFLDGKVINIFVWFDGQKDFMKNEREVALKLNECLQSLLKK